MGKMLFGQCASHNQHGRCSNMVWPLWQNALQSSTDSGGLVGTIIHYDKNKGEQLALLARSF